MRTPRTGPSSATGPRTPPLLATGLALTFLAGACASQDRPDDAAEPELGSEAAAREADGPS